MQKYNQINKRKSAKLSNGEIHAYKKSWAKIKDYTKCKST